MKRYLPLTLLALLATFCLQAGSRLESILEPLFTTPAPLEPASPKATEPALHVAHQELTASSETQNPPQDDKKPENPSGPEPSVVAAPSPKDTPLANPSQSSPPPAHILNGTELIESLHHAIKEAYMPNGDLEVQLSRNWAPLALPQREWSLKMINNINDALASYMTVRFELACGPLKLGPFVVGVRCSLWQEGWMSKGDLKRGTALEPHLFVAKRVDTLRSRGELVALDAPFADYELTRRLPAKRPLTQSDIAAKPLIRRGEIFDVIAEEGQLHICMKAMALENGTKGDVIQARNLISNKIIHAQVTHDRKGKVPF